METSQSAELKLPNQDLTNINHQKRLFEILVRSFAVSGFDDYVQFVGENGKGKILQNSFSSGASKLSIQGFPTVDKLLHGLEKGSL